MFLKAVAKSTRKLCLDLWIRNALLPLEFNLPVPRFSRFCEDSFEVLMEPLRLPIIGMNVG